MIETLLSKLLLTEWTVHLRSADCTMYILSSFEYKYTLVARTNADKSEISLQAKSMLPKTFIELKGISYTISTAAKIDAIIESAHRDGNRIAVAVTAYTQAMKG